jgi:SLOG cluster3 family
VTKPSDLHVPAVVLSVSYAPREYKANSHEIAAAVKALSGAIFQQNWTLVFGGYPAIFPLILTIAREYGQRHRVMIYQSEYFRSHVGPGTLALLEEGYGNMEQVPNDPSELPPGPLETIDLTKCSKSLGVMWQQMIKHPRLCGLVLIGGDFGLLPELELFKSTHQNLPVIPIRAPGGIAREFEARIPGWPPFTLAELAASRYYFTLSTRIVRYLGSRLEARE